MRAGTANNHLLNTFLMRFFKGLFGSGEIVLRLPNVFAFLLYCYFCYKILIKSKTLTLLFVGISFLLLNPYLLDFFSLARGYGLALGFAMAAMYFMIEKTENDYKDYLKRLALSSGFCLLSSFSNLSFLNLEFAVLFIFLLELILSVKNKSFQLNRMRIIYLSIILLINFFFLAILISQLLILKNHNELYFGGSIGFLHDTIPNLIFNTFYFSIFNPILWLIVRILILFLFATAIGYSIYQRKDTPIVKTTLVLCLLVIIPLLQHYLFDSLFPVHRTSLLFVPVFGLLVFHLFSAIQLHIENNKKRTLPFNATLLLLFCLPMAANIFNSINLKHTKEWVTDANTKHVMNKIEDYYSNTLHTGQTISLSCNWVFEPAINYYRSLYSMEYLKPTEKTGLDLNTDFIYCTTGDKENLTQPNSFSVLENYPETESVLLMKSTGN